MKTVTKITFLLLIAISIFSTACKKDKNTGLDIDSTGKTGTFKVDGVSYTGNTTIQTFASGSYSILCQTPIGSANSEFVQITFHSKEEAEAGGTFIVDDYRIGIPSGKVNIGTLDVITADPNSSNYTIKVSGKKITIDNPISITSTGTGSTSATINSAIINF